MAKKKSRFKKKLMTTNSYPLLVNRVKQELSNLEFVVKRQTVETYWRIGKYVFEHLLENKNRAGYGDYFYERLSLDVGRDRATLFRTVQFYRTYPILATWQELSWSHYRILLSVGDQQKRKKWEKQAVSKRWNIRDLNKYIRTQREKENKPTKRKTIPQLSLTRGQLHTYKVLKDTGRDLPLLIDCGFQIRRQFPEAKTLRIKEGDFIAAIEKAPLYTTKKVTVIKEELFTYKAYVERVIDGDTLLALIDCDFGILIRQRLRLRGIDCPELDTTEGQRAKRFAQDRLRGLDFVIIKTCKSDKYDRYLTDVFYLLDETDEDVVTQEGHFLNQELLDQGLAVLV